MRVLAIFQWKIVFLLALKFVKLWEICSFIKGPPEFPGYYAHFYCTIV